MIPSADPLAGPGRRATLPTPDGVRVVIADGPRERRFLVLAPDLPEPGTPLLATVAFDAPRVPQIAGIERLAALMMEPDPPAELAAYQTDMLRRVLQGLDAALAGASLRATRPPRCSANSGCPRTGSAPALCAMRSVIWFVGGGS